MQVDVNKFAKFLYSYQINPTNVILCTPTRAGLGKTVLAYNSNHPPLFDAQVLWRGRRWCCTCCWRYLGRTFSSLRTSNPISAPQDLYLTYYLPVILVS